MDEASEVLFYRLLMLADDFGRFDGRVSVIRARAFALRQTVSEAQVIHRLKELCKVGLIYCYAAAGKPYLAIPRFDQRQRAEKSKFPAPPDGWQSNDGQTPVEGRSSAAVVVDVDVGVKKKTPLPLSGEFLSFWTAYPKHIARQAALKAWKKLSPNPDQFAQVMKALELAKASQDWLKNGGQYIPHAATWLNGRRFEDELTQGNVASLYRREGVM